MTRVVAGILYRREFDGFLVGKRLDGKGWEFPGGKVEEGETDQQALRREWAEELGPGGLGVEHYPRATVALGEKYELWAYRVVETHGWREGPLTAHSELRFLRVGEIQALIEAEGGSPAMSGILASAGTWGGLPVAWRGPELPVFVGELNPYGTAARMALYHAYPVLHYDVVQTTFATRRSGRWSGSLRAPTGVPAWTGSSNSHESRQ